MAKPPLQDESASSSDSPKKSVPVGANPFAGAGGGLSKPTGKNDKPVAIALRYQKEKDPAPRVVATGEGGFAEQLLEIAFANGVKVREDADLAQVLSVVEVDSIIPLEAFAAVALIIAFLYWVNAGHSVVGGLLSDSGGLASGTPGSPYAPKPMDTENPLQARARIAADAMRAWNEAAEAGAFVPGEATPESGNSESAPDRPAGAAAPGTHTKNPDRKSSGGSGSQDGHNEPPSAPDFLDLASKTDKTR